MSENKNTELDIIIVTWNTKSLTHDCVDAILKITHTERIGSTIWVVDNKSEDGTALALRKDFPNINIIENNYNAGFSIANNIAIRRSSSPFVLLLNSDAFLRPKCLSTLLAALKTQAGVGAVGPRLFHRSGDIQHSVARITSPTSQLGYLLAFCFPPLDHWIRPIFNRSRDVLTSGNENREVPLLSAACLLLRRTVFEQVGLLPEDRFLYSEEDDLFFRMRERNIKALYIPAGEAMHLGGESTKQVGKASTISAHFIRSRLRFLFQHYPKARFFTFAMHWLFFSWCHCLSKTKYIIRKKTSDLEYIRNYHQLRHIAISEYNLLSDAAKS